MMIPVTEDALFIGLISGTSVNSIDAALVRFQDNRPELLAAHEEPIGNALQAQLLALTQSGADELNRLAQLDNTVARIFADAVRNLLAKTGYRAGQIGAIGSHGQTVRHAPAASDPYTVQIGNPSLLAELSGIPVVADFRRRDMAAGGQGAPLAPVFHAAFFGSPEGLPKGLPEDQTEQDRAVVNIGGIANISVLKRDGSVLGFDIGPGNALLDVWISQKLGLQQDTAGAWAQTGQVNEELLQRCLSEPYFALPPPKSTGRELFHLAWLQTRLAELNSSPPPQDVQATLVALTASSIGSAIQNHAPAVTALFVCGGGVHNPAIMTALKRALPGVQVASTAALGVDPDYMEAMGFAWLARQTLLGRPGNLPSVTGARGLRILGGIYPA